MANSQVWIGVHDHDIHARHREDLGDSAAHVSGTDDGDVLHHLINPCRTIRPHLHVDVAYFSLKWGSALRASNLDEAGTGILGLP